MLFSKTTPAVLASIFIGFTLSAGAFACSTDGWDFASPTIEVGSPYGTTLPDVSGVSRFEELCALKADEAELVRTNSPSHGRVRGRLYAYPDLSVARTVGGAAVVVAYSGNDGGGSELFHIAYDGGNWTVDAVANGGTSNSVAATGGWDSIEFDWDPGTNNIDVWINADATSVGPTFSINSGTTATTMESLEVGLPVGLGGHTGTLYVDSVELRNETAIGLVPNCDAMPDGSIDFNDLLAQYNEIFNNMLATGTPDCDFSGQAASGGVVDFNDILAAYNIIFPPPP